MSGRASQGKPHGQPRDAAVQSNKTADQLIGGILPLLEAEATSL